MFLRAAEPDDAMAVARVHVRSWQAAYRTLLPDVYLDQLRPEERAQSYDFANTDSRKPRTIVALDGSLICGFVTAAPSRNQELADYGELCALYVDPEYWGRGYGVALVSAARGHLSSLGFQNVSLWLLAGNARAARFYAIDGWISDGCRRTESIWGVTVDEIRYRRGL